MKPFIGNGLVVTEGDEWKRSRRIIEPAFKVNALKEMTPIFVKVFGILL
jgi:cytochrome P450